MCIARGGEQRAIPEVLCIKASGTYLQENIQFWLEVQRYKMEPSHSHAGLVLAETRSAQ